MKKSILWLSALVITLSSCVKDAVETCPYNDSSATASSAEIAALEDYFVTNSISPTRHPSGVYYMINRAGSGATPGVCNQINVKYSGYLLGSSTAFDSNTSATGAFFTLGTLIVGWQKGLSVLNTGGAITLYIPPSLGYGSNPVRNGNGDVVIPGNAYLKFDIELLAIQ